ncbi:MAG: phosphodiester glycosidase family protein [Saprospiraceae bacterium]
MGFKVFGTLLLFLSLIKVSGQSTADTTWPELSWSTYDMHPGVQIRTIQTDVRYHSRQSIQLLILDPAKVAFDLGSSDSVLVTTSEFAKRQETIAAINGGFFDTKKGGAVAFIQDNYRVINDLPSHEKYIDEAGILIDTAGYLTIAGKPCMGWFSQSSYPDVLTSGPYIVSNRDMIDERHDPFHDNRHPRSAIGRTLDEKILLAVVDGRSAEAQGMTIPELSNLLLELGCYQALNLDGGGSSTLWIKGMGVINHPSDNRQFDAGGERPVANCLLILSR